MNTKTSKLFEFDLERFQSIIRNAVSTALQEHNELFNSSEKEFKDEYLTRKEAAEFLKISETSLWNLDKTQMLPAKRLNGKVLYLKSQLLNFENFSEIC